jgi:cytochrome c5
MWFVTGALALMGCSEVKAPVVVAVAPQASASVHKAVAGALVVARGVGTFEDNCVKCHGFVDNVAPTLEGVTGRMDYATFTKTVRGGRNLMPAHPEIRDDQLEALWALSGSGHTILQKQRAGEGCAMTARSTVEASGHAGH